MKARNYVGLIVNEYECIGQHQERYPSGRCKTIVSIQCQSCGNKKDIKADTFSSGQTGCLKCNPQHKFKNRKTRLGSYYSQLRNNAKRRGYSFLISKNDIEALLARQNSKCKLSSVSISFEAGTASLDRINNVKGYTIDNIQWVHRTVNYMKNELSESEFIDWCLLVSENRKTVHHSVSKP